MLQRFFIAIRNWWKGVWDFMAVVYATLILNGARTFADVPAMLKEQVKQVLIDLGMGELAE